MAAITWADVEDIAPELTAENGVNIEAQNMILAFVNNHMNVIEWGGESDEMLKLGRIYLAAHLGTLSTRESDKPGAVTSESAGGLSRSYAVAAGSSALLDSTNWGQAYQMITRMKFAGPFV